MVFRYFWPKEGLKLLKKQKGLEFNQTGGRTDMSTIVNATINELIAEYHRITRQQIWIHQDDSSALIRSNNYEQRNPQQQKICYT